MQHWLTYITYSVLLCAAAITPAYAADPDLDVEVNKGEIVRLDRPVESVIIAHPATADVQVISPHVLFVYGQAVGQTNLIAIDANDETIINRTVRVTHNLSELQKMIHEVAPNADVDFRSTNGGMIMKGRATSPTESEDIRTIAQSFIGDDTLVNMISTRGSNQVALQVRIVEMLRSDLKRFGVNLQAALSPSNFGLQILQGADIALGGDGVLDRANNNSALYSNFNDGQTSVSGMIDMLQTNGLASVLAEPNLTTTSGKPASFLAGGEFPIQIVGPDGTPGIEYRDFGVGLDFTPTVLSKDRISIDVAPEVSTISFDNPVAGNPIVLTRRAQATVEVGSGQTFVLAGLLQRDINTNVSKMPGIGDVPVLGALFRSNQFQNDLTELVILVTPYIVEPVSDHSLQTPMDGYVPPSDVEFLLEGNLYRQEEMEPGDELPKLHGGGGFIY